MGRGSYFSQLTSKKIVEAKPSGLFVSFYFPSLPWQVVVWMGRRAGRHANRQGRHFCGMTAICFFSYSFTFSFSLFTLAWYLAPLPIFSFFHPGSISDRAPINKPHFLWDSLCLPLSFFACPQGLALGYSFCCPRPVGLINPVSRCFPAGITPSLSVLVLPVARHWALIKNERAGSSGTRIQNMEEPSGLFRATNPSDDIGFHI